MLTKLAVSLVPALTRMTERSNARLSAVTVTELAVGAGGAVAVGGGAVAAGGEVGAGAVEAVADACAGAEVAVGDAEALVEVGLAAAGVETALADGEAAAGVPCFVSIGAKVGCEDVALSPPQAAAASAARKTIVARDFRCCMLATFVRSTVMGYVAARDGGLTFVRRIAGRNEGFC